MRLTNELFHIDQKHEDGKATVYTLTLNAEHLIYKAHFPGEPITPGVCLIQMAKELLEDILDEALRIVAVKNVKFLNIVSPVSTPRLICSLTVSRPQADNSPTDSSSQPVSCSATISWEDTTYTKISFTCQHDFDA